MPHKQAPASVTGAPVNRSGLRRGFSDPETARKAAHRKHQLAAERRAALANPQELAKMSLARMVTVGLRVARGLEGKQAIESRDDLEKAKLLVAIDQTIQDRVEGRPRTVTGRDAPAQLHQYEASMRDVFGTGPAVPPPEPIEGDP